MLALFPKVQLNLESFPELLLSKKKESVRNFFPCIGVRNILLLIPFPLQPLHHGIYRGGDIQVSFSIYPKDVSQDAILFYNPIASSVEAPESIFGKFPSYCLSHRFGIKEKAFCPERISVGSPTDELTLVFRKSLSSDGKMLFKHLKIFFRIFSKHRFASEHNFFHFASVNFHNFLPGVKLLTGSNQLPFPNHLIYLTSIACITFIVSHLHNFVKLVGYTMIFCFCILYFHFLS